MIEYKIGVWLDRSVKELKIAKETVLQEVENYIKATKEVFEEQEKIIKLYKELAYLNELIIQKELAPTGRSLAEKKFNKLGGTKRKQELLKIIKEIEENE